MKDFLKQVAIVYGVCLGVPLFLMTDWIIKDMPIYLIIIGLITFIWIDYFKIKKA